MKVTINAFVYQNTSFGGEITHSIQVVDIEQKIAELLAITHEVKA